MSNSIIFRFTLKRPSSKQVETHFVRANTVERATQALSTHLQIAPELIRNNNKNVPYKLREKVLNNVTELDEHGNPFTYRLTVDLQHVKQEATPITGNTLVVDSPVEQEQPTQLATPVTSGTYRYDIESLFREDERVLRKYAGVHLSQAIDTTLRKRAYSQLRAAIIRDNMQDKHYKTNNTNNKNKANHKVLEPLTLLEILDAYSTNFSKPF